MQASVEGSIAEDEQLVAQMDSKKQLYELVQSLLCVLIDNRFKQKYEELREMKTEITNLQRMLERVCHCYIWNRMSCIAVTREANAGV